MNVKEIIQLAVMDALAGALKEERKVITEISEKMTKEEFVKWIKERYEDGSLLENMMLDGRAKYFYIDKQCAELTEMLHINDCDCQVVK